MVSVVNNEYWNKGYENLNLNIIPKSDVIRLFIENKFKNQGNNLTCFEFGIYPGRYAAVFGNMGYEINGVDQTEYMVDRLPQWFDYMGYKHNYLHQGDALNLSINKKFDVVYSVGFIEHFTNYRDIIQKHVDLLNNNGVLFITVPNFKGFIQYFLHYLLDKDNLDRHYVPSMDPIQWAKQLGGSGLQVESYGWMGGYDFWVDNQKRNIFQKLILELVC